MKWMVPINDLDAVRTRAIEKIINNQYRNHWAKGFAGSGKTIAFSHVLERLAASNKPIRVCFATFTHAQTWSKNLNLQVLPLSKVITICTFLANCRHFSRKQRDNLGDKAFKLLRVDFNWFVFGVESHVVDIC